MKLQIELAFGKHPGIHAMAEQRFITSWPRPFALGIPELEFAAGAHSVEEWMAPVLANMRYRAHPDETAEVRRAKGAARVTEV